MPRAFAVAAPLLLLVLPPAHAEEPLRRTIDAELAAAWKAQQRTPAAPADDAAFLRRVHLDLVGVIPTHDETRAFLDATDAAKREKLVDRLLNDPRWAAHQANVWDLLLFGRHPANPESTRKRDGFVAWLTERFAHNDPFDRWARELLLAESEGPALYYVQFRNQPEEATVAVSRTFLGIQLQCARCHDHPYEAWTQRDFYGMAAFFARLVVVEEGSGEKRRFVIGEKGSGDVLFAGPAKELKPGQKGEPIKPKFLAGAALEEPTTAAEPPLPPGKLPPKPAFSRKEKLAAWVTAADNPTFARAAANRVWAQYLGRGLVHPVDDLSPRNAPSHPALLDALTRHLVAHHFDLKDLTREIVLSRGYQLGGGGPVTDAQPLWFERARVRPLTAEEMLASMRVACGVDPADKVGGDVREYFLRYFGEPTNGLGDFQASLQEHLFLNYSEHVRRMIVARKGNLADTLLRSTAPWEERVDRLFLSVLNRPPRPEERKRFTAHFTSGGKPEALVEEAVWALLNCSEFRFNR